MVHQFYFKNLITAGIFMAMLATKFGTQSELHTLNSHYSVTAKINVKQLDVIAAYAEGLVDGREAQ